MSLVHRLLPALLVLSLAAGGGACRGGAGAAEQTVERPAVTVPPENLAVATVLDLAAGPALSGSLVPDRQATLRSEIAATVVEVRIEPGQSVPAGQLLVRLDDTAITDALRSAQSAVRTAQEALVVARRDAERATRLARVGAVADRDVEQAAWNVTNAEGALADAQARLASAEKQMQKTVFRAPFAGIVSERPVRAGDVVQSGNALVTVVDPRSLRLEAGVPVEALEALKIGTPVDFGVGGLEGRSFRGRVTRVNPVLDQSTGQVRVTVSIPNIEGRLVGGLFAQGRVATERTRALAIPLSALDQRGTGPTVRRLRAGVVELVPVSLGLRDDVREQVEIRDGLAPGDTVLVGGARGIAPGTPVVVTKE